MNKTLLFLFIAFFHFSANAQSGRQVSGIISDSTGIKIIAASVKLISARDTLTSSTNDKGAFVFRDVKTSVFIITVTRLGYEPVIRKYLYKEGISELQLDPIILKFESKLLNEVVISGTPAVVIKEDTVEYRASDYQLRENALAEDLLKKLPGIEVDKDGNVKAQGKAVTRVRVNGKDFFGGDLKTATQQIPANIIDKIQIVEDYGDQANLTGIKDGDPERILNIQTQPNKNNGYFARATLGGGNKERYQASVTANSFRETQQLSVLANLNNTNASLFNFSGGAGGGGRIQIMGGGGGRGPAQGGGDGITSVGSLGLNYRDEWSKKVSSYGSYSFSNRNNDVLSNEIRQNNFQNSLISNDQNNNNNTISNNHRLNWNLEYKIDSLNFIKFSPTFNYSLSDNEGISNYLQSNNTALISQGSTFSNTGSETPSLGANLLLNHRFPKRGRNISLNLSLNSSENDSEEDQINEYINYDAAAGNTDVYRRQQLDILNRNLSSGATLSYNEPLSRTANLEFNYSYNYSHNNNERQTYDIDETGNSALNTDQSNDYDYSFTTSNIGMNYRVNQKRYNYSLGASIQPTVLEGNAVISNVFTTYRNTGLNFIPVARFAYNFSKTRSFNVRYFGRSSEPSYSQLQPIANIANPQYPIFGNPDLNAEFNHSLNMRYNNFDFASGNVLFTSLTATFAQNKIVTNISRRNDPAIGLIQETRYLNTDGYYAVNGFYNFSKPFAERKYVFSLNGSANFNNNVSFSDDEKNTGRNWILSQGLNVQLNPSKWLEINPGFSYSFNKNSNDLVTNSNTEVSTYGINFNSKTYFLKTWLIGIDLNKTFNSGYSSLLAADPFIMNTYLEKQFFKNKNGTLRLQSYDLFNENTSVSRNVTATSITDSRNNRLSRYFMLSFTMRLQKFNGQQSQMQMPGRENRMQMRGGNTSF